MCFQLPLNSYFFPFAFSLSPSLPPSLHHIHPPFLPEYYAFTKVVNTRQRGMSHSSKTTNPQSSEKVHYTFYRYSGLVVFGPLCSHHSLHSAFSSPQMPSPSSSLSSLLPLSKLISLLNIPQPKVSTTFFVLPTI